MKIKFVLAAFIWLAIACVASAEVSETAEARDPRLDQKVTFSAKAITLHEAFEDLTERTGVQMIAGKGVNDWEVRDLKVSLFVQDMPLGDIQKTLAELLRLTWAIGEEEGAYTYRLFKDMRSRREESELRSRAAREEAQRQMEKRQSIFSQFADLDSFSPEEIEKLKTEAPLLHLLAKEPIGKAVSELLRGLPPDAQYGLVSGNEMTLDLARMPAQFVESARGVVQGFDALHGKVNPNADAHIGLTLNIDSAKIAFRGAPEGAAGDHMSAGLMGVMEIMSPGRRSVTIPLFDPRSPMANALGRMLMKLDGGAPIQEIGREMQSEFGEIMMEQLKSTEPESQLPDDPELDEKVKIELGDQSGFPDFLDQLAKKSGLQIISDEFPTRSMQISSGENTIRKHVQNAALLYGKEPKKDRRILTFQDRKWYEKRAYMIRESLLESWRDSLKKRTFGFSDLLDMASLTDDQITNTLILDSQLQTVARSAMQNRSMLRLYSVMSDLQRRALSTEDGLHLADLTENQWIYMQDLLSKSSDKAQSAMNVALKFQADNDAHRYALILMNLDAVDDDESDKELARWNATITLPAPDPEPEKPKKDSADVDPLTVE